MKKTVLALTICLALSFLMIVGAEVSFLSEDSWSTLAPMPTARRQFGVAVVNVKIFAVGGNDGNFQRYLDTNEMYDPVSNTWLKKARMPTPRIGFGIAVYKNKIYVLGGAIGVDPSGNGNTIISSSNEAYDPVTDTWETKAPMPTPRHGLTASVVDDKIYLISGFQNSEVSNYLLDYGSVKNEVYDPETNTWTTKPPIPNGVFNAVSATVGDKIYVLGGDKASLALFGPTNFNQVYDTKQEIWTSASPVPVGISGAAGAVFRAFMSEKVCLFGGSTDSSNEPCNLTQIYNPSKDVWVTGAQMPTPHALFGVANVNDELYAIGGSSMYSNSRLISDANEKYVPTSITEDILVYSPQNKTYEGNSQSLNFTIDNTTSWMGYSLDGQEKVTVAGNTTITGLTVGMYNVTVYATDFYGKTGASETITFTIAESFPIVTVIAFIIIVALVSAILLVYLKKRKSKVGQV